MKKIIMPLLVVSTMASCSNTSNFEWRGPASVHKHKLFEILEDIQISLGKNQSAKSCHKTIEYYWQKLYEIDVDVAALDQLSDEELNDYIKSSFYIRLGIKERLKELKNETEDDQNCLRSIKRAFTALRYVEDYLIEYRYTKSSPDKDDKDYITLTGKGGHFLVNPKFSDFESWKDLKSGDALLSRGNAFSSAAIARIGLTDTQFSHMSLVYKDKKDQLHTSEAHIEIGNVVAPISVHLDQKNARTVVFRADNERLADEAGAYMYKLVKTQQDKGKNIEYDFGMDYKNADRLFCSEVVYLGYKEAAKRLGLAGIEIPEYKTAFHKGLLKFLQTLGIKVDEKNIETFRTFGPGDIQFDSRFDIVAEWRNPVKLRDSRFKDAILTKLFIWMENEGYNFDPSTTTGILSRFSYMARRSDIMMSLLKKFAKKDLEHQFPLNMSAKQMSLFLVLDEVGEYFYAELDKLEKEKKRPLGLKEMFDHLDKLKNEDHALWQKWRAQRYVPPRDRIGQRIAEPKFHRRFHPKK